MRLVYLDEKNKNRYKVVFSREDRKKLLLGIAIQVILVILIFYNIAFIILISFVFWAYLLSNSLYSWVNYIFNSWGIISYSVTILFFTALPGLLWYFTSFESFFKPFDFRGVVIDVAEKKIFLKNKTFSFKDTDSLVFSLEKKRERNTAPPKNNKKKGEKKENKRVNWVYHVKKKAFPEPTSEELDTNELLANNFEEYIIPPTQIKYLEDFSLVLGKEGLLGVWRRITELLGICFEENIDFKEEILLQPSNDAFPPKTSNDFPLNQEMSSLTNEIKEDETKMREVLVFLREKVDGKDISGGIFWGSGDLQELFLLDEDLMGVRMLSNGFELRFWKDYSVFPYITKERVINHILEAIIFFVLIISFFLDWLLMPAIMAASIINDIIARGGKFFIQLLFIIYSLAYGLRMIFGDMRSKSFLFLIMYFFEHFSLFTGGILLLVMSFFTQNLEPKVILFFFGLIIVFIEFSFFLIPLQRSSCSWELNINRYASRLVFSFEDKILQGEHGLCVSRTHWRAPISKIQSLAVLGEKYSFWTCEFLLAIRIEEDYVLLPLPCFRGDKIRKILSFLQEIFNTLLASYSLNNTEATK